MDGPVNSQSTTAPLASLVGAHRSPPTPTDPILGTDRGRRLVDIKHWQAVAAKCASGAEEGRGRERFRPSVLITGWILACTRASRRPCSPAEEGCALPPPETRGGCLTRRCARLFLSVPLLREVVRSIGILLATLCEFRQALVLSLYEPFGYSDLGHHRPSALADRPLGAFKLADSAP
jgi:hypothetical protein